MLTHPSPEDIKDNLVVELLNTLVKRGQELNLTDAIFHHNFLISLGHAFQQEEVFAIPALILSPSHGIVIVGTQSATPEQIEKFGSSEGLLQNAVFKLITHVVQNKFLRTNAGPLIPFNVVLFGKHFLGQSLRDYRTTKICATEAQRQPQTIRSLHRHPRQIRKYLCNQNREIRRSGTFSSRTQRDYLSTETNSRRVLK